MLGRQEVIDGAGKATIFSTKGPRQEGCKDHERSDGVHSVLSRCGICIIKSLAIGILLTLCGVGVFSKETAHDAVKGEIEEACLDIHSVSIARRLGHEFPLQETAEHFCFFDEDILHHAVEVLSWLLHVGPFTLLTSLLLYIYIHICIYDICIYHIYIY